VKIAIFGLGYVGSVTGACLARRGHSVIGVDVQEGKVDAFTRGEAPIVEPGLAELLRAARDAGRLSATTDADQAVGAADVSLVCVGTPSTLTGTLDSSFVRQVASQIASAVARAPKRHALVLRSTLLPGSTRALANEVLAAPLASGLLDLFYYPEFLREGSGIADFDDPSLAAVGTSDGAEPSPALRDEFFGVETPAVTWETAELLKYTSNAFHATKIAFANEIGRLGKVLAVDARRVMELLATDDKLALSSYYLKPGNPFGGSCLPKDLRALVRRARQLDLDLPLLESALPSNERHLDSLLSLVTKAGKREIVILGLSFKAETDDLRESSMVEVAQTLHGRGYELRIYDPTLDLRALVGSNRRLIEAKMPHLASMLHGDLGVALGRSGTVLAAQRVAPIARLAEVVTPEHHVIDVNGWPELERLAASYEGLCW
jgi:GDP-mannose 6-dehydrogenase